MGNHTKNAFKRFSRPIGVGIFVAFLALSYPAFSRFLGDSLEYRTAIGWRRYSPTVRAFFFKYSGVINLIRAEDIFPAISHAVACHDKDLAMLSLDYVDPKKMGLSISNPLIVAGSARNFEMAEEFIKRGADPNQCIPSFCILPLSAAAGSNDVRILKLLLDNGAELRRSEGFSGTALDSAFYKGSVEAAQFLMEADLAKETSLSAKAKKSYLSHFKQELAQVKAARVAANSPGSSCASDRSDPHSMECFLKIFRPERVRSGHLLSLQLRTLHGLIFEESPLSQAPKDWDYFFLSYAASAIEDTRSKDLFFSASAHSKTLSSTDLKAGQSFEQRAVADATKFIKALAERRYKFVAQSGEPKIDDARKPASINPVRGPLGTSDWKNLKDRIDAL